MTYKIVDDTGYVLANGIKGKGCATNLIYNYRLCPGDMLEIVKE